MSSNFAENVCEEGMTHCFESYSDDLTEITASCQTPNTDFKLLDVCKLLISSALYLYTGPVASSRAFEAVIVQRQDDGKPDERVELLFQRIDTTLTLNKPQNTLTEQALSAFRGIRTLATLASK
ncbi:unnamed protein product [Nippostrongylus brasiliensis]|uniref:WAPL domain-containing protein n=1 Tax=Nippostrongylus brasiliensis TaxID=27835 RepID=A0A0N4XLG4_NIPBR|nr:unnamed protein product [Nippostrongylus brasiliensis]